MYQSERMDEIMKIVKKNHYVTVDYLVKEIKYSPASIRRDLTVLEKQGLVTRSYGGVTFKDANNSPFKFRQHSMKTAKHAIAAKAATLVKKRRCCICRRIVNRAVSRPLFNREKGNNSRNVQYDSCRFFK